MALKSIIATVRGVEVELEWNAATGYYEKSYDSGLDSSFPEDGGFFPVSIVATDDADLSTPIDHTHSVFGDNLKLFVRETHKPYIEITSPATGSYITSTTTPEIKFEVYDNRTQKSGYAGIDKDTLVLKIDEIIVDNASVVSEEVIEDGRISGYKFSYVPTAPLDNGDHTITVTCSDYDGNEADAVSKTFEIDNTAPELYVEEFSGVTSQSVVVIRGTASDKNGPVTVRVYLNGVEKGTVAVDESTGTFECSVNLELAGNNTIKIVAFDRLENKSTEIEGVVKYNTTAPIFEAVEILYNDVQISGTHKVPTSNQYIIRCKVTAQ